MNKTRKRKKKSKKGKKTRKMNKDMCSPKLKGNKVENTCYNKKSLLKMKKIWNMKHPGMKIMSKEPGEILKELDMRMNNSCKRESCWLNHLYEDNKLKKKQYDENFAPVQPKSWSKNPNEWLSSTDIINVMKQRERMCKRFEFIGPSPIDYDTHTLFGECVWEELCEFNLKDMIDRGIYKVGIIFNLDPHDKPGSHWVCVFIHIKKKYVYWFDSYGEKPEKQIKKFMNMVLNQASKLGLKYKYLENKVEHQRSDSECGMYCLFVIIKLLEGKSPSYFNKRIKDRLVMNLRNKYFNKIN